MNSVSLFRIPRAFSRTLIAAVLLSAALGLFSASVSACTIMASTPIPLPTAEVPSLFEVEGAIDRWEASGNENYFVSVEETRNSGTHLYRIVIVDGAVQAAQQLERVDGVWQQPAVLDPETAEQYTVDALLARILRDVNGDGAAPLNMFVAFDNVSGYPTLVDAKAIQSYTDDGRIALNREHSYLLTIEVGVLLEDTIGLNKTPLLTLARSGGERAACSLLRIFTDGSSIYSDNCRQVLLQLRPPESSFTRLEALAAALPETAESRTADGETLTLTLHGSGTAAPDQGAIDEAWALAVELDQLLSQPIGEGITMLIRDGDTVLGYDLRTSAVQPAALDITPPLYGGIVDPAGRLLIYGDGAGLKWLDVVSGDGGTYLTNSAAEWVVPVALTGDGRVVLNRHSSGGAAAEWGWISVEERAWHAFPEVGSCISSAAASPLDSRIVVTTSAGEGCSSEAAVWMVDLAAGSANPLVPGFPGGADSAGWSADGAWVAFSAFPDGAGGPEQLYLVRPDGSELTTRTDHAAGEVTGLRWSPAGGTLVYGLAGAGEAENGLYEIDPATGEVLASLPGDGLVPIGLDNTGEFLAFADADGLHVWVISFGQVQPVMLGGAADPFIGFVGSG